MSSDLIAIDWSVPWLAPWRSSGQSLAAHAVQIGLLPALNHAACERAIVLRAGPLRFVSQAECPPGEAYEAFIARTACVPTRVNLHDFFNGLAWLVHPALKRRLNELQASELAVQRQGAPRGAVRDALTLFDENGAWLQAPPPLCNALSRRDWSALFTVHRHQWSQAKLSLFGHALIEKLLRPRKAITAHVWVLPDRAPSSTSTEPFDELLKPQTLAAKPFLPLPVLGVPNWWAANESPGFYRDASVFRPPRVGKPALK